MTVVGQRHGRGALAGRRILVGYSNASTFTTTTKEYVESFGQFSGAEVHYLHVTHDAAPIVDLEAYDAVLLSYCARLCFPGYVSEHFLRKLDSFTGIRAIAIQDEYDNVELERVGLDRLRPHLVLTCVPDDQRERVYPTARYPRTRFVQVLTGYVSTAIDPAAARRPVAGRPITIGYRGRDLGPRYGALGHMKYEVGARAAAEAARRGVPCDIRMDEDSRIYGDAWYRWLADCRCVLGSESGSNVFDWDGSIARATRGCADMATVPGSVRSRIDALDREFSMGQVSARVFEAAMVGTPLALYRGRYSGVLEPGEHYIPIETDHSNWDEVFARLGDLDGLQAMADRAHAALIASRKWDYAAFLGMVDAHIAEAMGSAPLRQAPAPVEAPMTPSARPASEERPTTRPREFDSFQLRALRMTIESPGAQELGWRGVLLWVRWGGRLAARRVPFMRRAWRAWRARSS